MKKSLPIFIFVLLFSFSIKAQESTTFSNTVNSSEITKTSFFEWNFGIALVSFDTDAYIPFPGASALWGTTFINQENLIFEYEVGFAFPTLVTGKIGVGKRFNNTSVVIGVRPWPTTVYLQTSFSTTKEKSWIASIEGNPIDFGSIGNINVGYRWNITLKKVKIEIE
jgi:hypothetical protein